MQDQINHPVAKALTPVGLALMGYSVGEWASLLACICSLLFIFEWMWKRVLKPLALRRGWMVGKPRDFMDSTDRADLSES